MTEYKMLIRTHAGFGEEAPKLEEGGIVEANSREQAVRKYMDRYSMEELENRHEFGGNGHKVPVVAVPTSYMGEYDMNFKTGEVL